MKGLTNEQVKMSREKYGSNKLPEPKLKKWYEFAIENIFGDKTLMLLLALSAYEIFAAVFGLSSFSEPIMVILVISLYIYWCKNGAWYSKINTRTKSKDIN